MKNLSKRVLSIFIMLIASILADYRFSSAAAETSNCEVIESVPTTIVTQGVYCLKGHLVTSISSGAAINVRSNNVVIDLNGWKLAGATAGPNTLTSGINSVDVKNLTIRNGIIRGFRHAILSNSSAPNSSGHIYENLLLEGNRFSGINMIGAGSGNIIRNNRIINTGFGTTTVERGFGIRVFDGVGGEVNNNIIENTKGRAQAGIVLRGRAMTIRNNTIVMESADRTSLSDGGILTTGTTKTLIEGNRIVNASGQGTYGINASQVINENGNTCLNNFVHGFLLR